MYRVFSLLCCLWLASCAGTPYTVTENPSQGTRTISFNDFSLTLSPSWQIKGRLPSGAYYSERLGCYLGYLTHDHDELEFTVQPPFGRELTDEPDAEKSFPIGTAGNNPSYRVQGSCNFVPNTNNRKVYVHLFVVKRSFSRLFYVDGILSSAAADTLVKILKTVRMPAND